MGYQDQQQARLKGDVSRLRYKFVADTQGDIVGQSGIFQRVFHPLKRDTVRCITKGEDREKRPCLLLECERTLRQGVEGIVAIPHLTMGTLLGQKGTSAAIGKKMIRPAAGCAQQQEVPKAQRKPMADGQHSVGIVFFRRDGQAGDGWVPGCKTGIEIPHQQVGPDILGKGVVISMIAGNDKV